MRVGLQPAREVDGPFSSSQLTLVFILIYFSQENGRLLCCYDINVEQWARLCNSGSCVCFNCVLKRVCGMFVNCGRARYNGLRMRKVMGRACARQWLVHVQSNVMRMAMVHVNGA